MKEGQVQTPLEFEAIQGGLYGGRASLGKRGTRRKGPLYNVVNLG